MMNQDAFTPIASSGRLAQIAVRQHRSRRKDGIFLALLTAATILGIASVAAANSL